MLTVGRFRATIVFWTGLGAAAILVSLLSLLRPVLHLTRGTVQLGPWPVPGVLGCLLVLHMQLVYASRLRLVLDAYELRFRNLLGTRRLAWTDIRDVVSVSALTPANRGGNMSGLRLRTATGDFTIPDVFTVRRDALRDMILHQISAETG